MERDDLIALGRARHEARSWRRKAEMAESLLEEVLTMTAGLGPLWGRPLLPVALDRILRRAHVQAAVDKGTDPVPSFTQAIPAREGEDDDHLRQQGRPEAGP